VQNPQWEAPRGEIKKPRINLGSFFSKQTSQKQGRILLLLISFFKKKNRKRTKKKRIKKDFLFLAHKLFCAP
jgi:hypothetical protein